MKKLGLMRFGLAMFLAILSADLSTAFDEKKGDSMPNYAKSRPQQAIGDAAIKASFERESLAWRNFTARYGQSWTMSVDARNMLPASVQGGGVPLLEEGKRVTLSDVDASVRGFIAENQGLFGVQPQDLRLNKTGSLRIGEDGRVWSIRYDVYHQGIRVLDAGVSLVINRGRLIQFGSERTGIIATNTSPEITREEAVNITFQEVGGYSPDDEIIEPATLAILPLPSEPKDHRDVDPTVYRGAPGQGYQYKLMYLVKFHKAGDLRTLVAYVDAVSGELIDLYDANVYGRVTGGVHPRTIDGDESIVPFPLTRVINQGAKRTNLGGKYRYDGGDASTSLDGKFFQISVDTCGNPFLSTSAAPGDLPLGTSGGTDCAKPANDSSTHAARNTFYHLHTVRLVTKKWLSIDWFRQTVPALVNIEATCNAFWDGVRVNFFRSGDGCNNTGEILDVIAHEWGHGLDQNTKGPTGDRAKGEAVGDLTAATLTHDQCVGPKFFQTPGGETPACPDSVRDLELFVTRGNIGNFCRQEGSCRGGLGFECHCESHILSGALWDLRKAFIGRYGTNQGSATLERLFYQAVPLITEYLPGRSGNAYDAIMTIDDDDGNVANGTPNADLIFTAFNAHEIAGVARPRFQAACTTPPEPPVATATTPRPGKVVLEWAPVPGATSYDVFRNESACTAPYLLRTTTASTRFGDKQVMGGRTYRYLVQTVAGQCRSPLGNTSCVEVTPS